MSQQKSSVVEELRFLFPEIAGVGPVSFTRRNFEREFRIVGYLLENEKDVLLPMRSVVEAANSVGLSVTVNDISRVVRECLRDLKFRKEKRVNSRPFPAIYKGVSYNSQTYGNGRGKGEWIVLLDFFSILRSLVNQLSQTTMPRFFILDAGLYWIANLLGSSISLSATSAESAAKQLLEILAQSLKQKRFTETLTTNRIRNAYLRAISEQFPANCAPPVVSLKDVWFDPEFGPFLAKSIALFCTKNSQKKWKVNSPVAYERYMPYSPWVTPLAAAETIFIGEKLKVSGILSPTAEAAWNKVNDQFSRAMNTPPFISWMYTRKLGKVLSYQTVPFFSDSVAAITDKLRAAQRIDPTTPQLVAGLISPFVGERDRLLAQTLIQKNQMEKLAEYIFSFLAPIEKRASELFASESDIPITPLDQAGWLSEFPPGIC